MSLVNQRHHLVLLFTDLTDSTRITADMEPEDYADLLTRLREITNRIIAHHGGEVVRIDGDGALCIFGYPLAHEDAGRRATEAALDLHAAMAELDGLYAPGLKLRLHSGIHAGVVLLRSGDLVRGRYEMLGDATNVAARLCDASSPDGLLVSAESLGGDANFFVTGQPQVLSLGGRRKSIHALPVLGRSDAATRFAARTRQRLTPLTGRDGQRAAIDEWLDGGPDTPATLLLHGPAGIGKSRLLAQVASDARARGWRLARGYCEAYLAARPLQPFLQIAAELSGGDAADLPAVTGPIGAEVARAAHGAPLMVMIDDWQWADDASRDQLAAMLAAAPAGRLRVLLASREGDAALPDGVAQVRVELPPLDEAAAHAAIGALLGTQEPGVIARITEAAGGSPLLLEELCLAQASRAATPSGEARGAWFDLAVQARFAALPPADAAMLRQAAIIGHIVPAWLLAAIQGEAIGAAMLDRLAEADFLYPGETGSTLSFKHGLTRDAVYAGIDLALRRDLHCRVLDVLEQRAQQVGETGLLDALAYHGGAAGQADKARDYAVRAGDAALAAGALDRAQAHYRAAFDWVETMPAGEPRTALVWSLLNKFGLASIVDPALEQLPVLERAAALLADSGDPAAQVRSAYWLGAIAYGLGLGQRSVGYLTAARRIAIDAQDDRFIHQIEVKLAQSLMAAGSYAEAGALFDEVLPRFDGLRGRNNQETLIYALCCRGFMLGDQGHMAEAEALFAQAETRDPAALTTMRPSLVTQKAALRLWQGDWAGAEALAREALQDCTRTRTRYLAMMSHALAAFARWRSGGDDAEVARMEDTARWFKGHGNSRQRTSLVFGWLTEMMAARGDAPAARRYAAMMVQRIREGGDRLGEAMAWRALARLEQRRERPGRADHYLHLADASARHRASPREWAGNRLCAARLASTRGDARRAAEEARQAAETYATLGMEMLRQRAEALAPTH